jgi:hypothetical protein
MRTWPVPLITLTALMAMSSAAVAACSLGQDVTASLTPTGAALLSLSCLMLGSIIAFTRRAHAPGWLIASLCFTLVALAVQDGSPGLSAALTATSLLVVVKAVKTLSRRPSPWFAAAAGVGAVCILVGLATTALGLLSYELTAASGSSTVRYIESPERDVTAIVEVNDPGAMGSVSYTVSVQHDLLRLIRRRITLRDGRGSPPAVRWLEEGTLEIGRTIIEVHGWRMVQP